MAKKLLVIEDEREIRTNLQYLLEAEGFEVLAADNGKSGITLAQKFMPDLILCDIMMPGLNGYEVIEQLRANSATLTIPVIFLTAKNSREDLRQGMQLGADDYISKPFTQRELLEAVKTRLQRQASLKSSFLQPVSAELLTAASTIKNLLVSLQQDTLPTQEPQTQPQATPEYNSLSGLYVSNGLVVDFEHHSVSVDGEDIKLSPHQYKLLTYLIENAGKTVTHKSILFNVWGPEYEKETQYLHVFVNQLRRKLEPNSHNPRFILTERGFGYRFNVSKPSLA